MTLEEMYEEYYGVEVSPKKFLMALEHLVDSSAETDKGNLGKEPV